MSNTMFGTDNTWGIVIFFIILFWVFKSGMNNENGVTPNGIVEAVNAAEQNLSQQIAWEGRLENCRDHSQFRYDNLKEQVEMERRISAEIQANGAKTDYYAFQAERDRASRAEAQNIALQSQIHGMMCEDKIMQAVNNKFGQMNSDFCHLSQQIANITPRPMTAPQFIPYGGYPTTTPPFIPQQNCNGYL